MPDEKVEKARCIRQHMLQGLYGNHPSVLDGSACAMFHPEPTSNDRLSSGKKKLGKRRMDEEGGRPPQKEQETASLRTDRSSQQLI